MEVVIDPPGREHVSELPNDIVRERSCCQRRLICDRKWPHAARGIAINCSIPTVPRGNSKSAINMVRWWLLTAMSFWKLGLRNPVQCLQPGGYLTPEAPHSNDAERIDLFDPDEPVLFQPVKKLSHNTARSSKADATEPCFQ